MRNPAAGVMTYKRGREKICSKKSVSVLEREGDSEEVGYRDDTTALESSENI